MEPPSETPRRTSRRCSGVRLVRADASKEVERLVRLNGKFVRVLVRWKIFRAGLAGSVAVRVCCAGGSAQLSVPGNINVSRAVGLLSYVDAVSEL